MINKELMPLAWHPKRWLDLCSSGDEKKDIGTILEII